LVLQKKKEGVWKQRNVARKFLPPKGGEYRLVTVLTKAAAGDGRGQKNGGGGGRGGGG